MNGVRRFLTGAVSQPDPPPPPIQTSPVTLPPLLPKSSRPSWPPQSPQQQPPPQLPSSPSTTTAALFLRKDKQRPIHQPSESDDLLASPVSSSRSSQGSSPLHSRKPLPAGPGTSSPRSSTRLPTRKPPPPNVDFKRTSSMLNTRDELLLSLLASEAVVDSREFEILSSEEVDELKKEQQILSSRLIAMNKKLTLETKIRDAAISLNKVNASHKKLSKQTEEQLESANRRVDAARQELYKLSERAHQVHRKLVEHRAGVLSYSVRSMESKMAPKTLPDTYNRDTDSGYDTPLNPMSPVSSVGTFASTPQVPFDGAHLFAGHANAVVPSRARSPDSTQREITALEQKLKAATESLTAAGKKQAEMARELSLLRLEKEEVETMMGMELQSAEDTIAALEQELPKLEGLDAELEVLREEKVVWEREREERDRMKERVYSLEASQAEKVGADELLAEGREQLERKERELVQLREQLKAEKEEWEMERALMQEERMEDLSRLQEEMDRAREDDQVLLRDASKELDQGLLTVQDLVRKHGIVLFTRDSSLSGLLGAIDTHLEGIQAKLDTHAQAESEWEATKRKLEDDVRAGLDKRESLSRQLEDARREREEARRETRDMEIRVRDSSPVPAPAFTFPPPTEYVNDAASIVALLRPVWTVLPSPEARAAKFSSRSFRPGSNPNSPTTAVPGSPIVKDSNAKSLSDLDVRSLKTLYDNRPSHPGSPGNLNGANAVFTVENFIARVQALIADDKALIERLIRFAQAHDLLKKNAERAQKLAQESNGALETYQKQVRTLEERNMSLSTRLATIQDEVQRLQDNLEQLATEKAEVEMHAAEQAETCRQLTDANNVLSARTLTLAEEAAAAPEMIKKQLEGQLAETRAALNQAQEEVDAMRMSEQSQRIALLDELNSMQTENGQLRAQLRALKK